MGQGQGLAAAERHREALLNGFCRVRQVLDDFAPDFVVIWGDDQYENFTEDIIPPFCILAYESMVPPGQEHRSPNVWDKSSDTTFTYRGHVTAGKFLVSGMLDAGFDLSYA